MPAMDAAWLKTQFRLNPDKNKAGLAESLGLSASAVSKILAGTRQIKAHEYVGMRRYFGLPVDGAAAAREGDRAPQGYVVAPLEGMREQRTAAPSPESWIIPAHLLQGRTQAAPDKVRIFAVQEQAMAPDFMPGQHILVDLSDTQPSPPGVFVVADGLGQIIRQCEYVPQSQPPQVRLSARAPGFSATTLPLAQAGILGRVIARLEWLK